MQGEGRTGRVEQAGICKAVIYDGSYVGGRVVSHRPLSADDMAPASVL